MYIDKSNQQWLKNQIIDYLARGIKRHNSGTLGLELEHFVVDFNDYSSLGFFGERSVESILNKLAPFFDEALYSEGHIIGLKRPKCLITLEPAAQIEASIGEFKKISDFKEEYDRLLSQINPILNEMNARLLNVGYQPTDKVASLKLIPKKRYALMDAHFKKSGSMGINMMRGTASTQVSIDYFSEEDFNKKFFIANALTPFFSYCFDNSPIFEGEKADRLCRVMVWNNVDNSRCGFAHSAFDSCGFGGYADYIVSSKPILLSDSNGNIVFTEDKTVAQLFKDREINKSDIEHILSMVFPYVRLKTYIEIRMPDSMPIKYALGFLALVKGIFYCEKSLNKIYQTLKNIDLKAAYDCFETLKTKEMVFGYSFNAFFDLLYGLALDGLDFMEHEYLANLLELKNKPRPLDLENILEKKGL